MSEETAQVPDEGAPKEQPMPDDPMRLAEIARLEKRVRWAEAFGYSGKAAYARRKIKSLRAKEQDGA